MWAFVSIMVKPTSLDRIIDDKDGREGWEGLPLCILHQHPLDTWPVIWTRDHDQTSLSFPRSSDTDYSLLWQQVCDGILPTPN